jgi:hypothetical protein
MLYEADVAQIGLQDSCIIRLTNLPLLFENFNELRFVLVGITVLQIGKLGVEKNLPEFKIWRWKSTNLPDMPLAFEVHEAYQTI